MENDSSFPFQLKLFQNKLPEIIIDEVITANHKVFPALMTLMQKFPVIFLEIKIPGCLTAGTKAFFDNLETPEKIVIIPETPYQIEADLSNIAVLPTVQAGLLRLKNKPGVETAAQMLANMPLMHSICFDYLEKLKDLNLGFSDVVKALEENPVTAGETLAAINKLDRVSTPFEKLDKAVSFVGVDGIRQIFIEKAFSILCQIFSNQPDRLKHMRRCSTLAGLLGERFSDNPHVYWKMRSAALMHDIGSLLISFYAPEEAARCRNVSKAQKIPLDEVENLLLGYNHTEAGLLMANMMHLPDYLIPTITNHHKKVFDKTDILLLSTRIANGYINLQSEHIGHTEYDECLNFLEEAKNKVATDKKDKEFKRRAARLKHDDEEGLQKLKELIYGKPEDNNPVDEVDDFRSKSLRMCFDPIGIEVAFKEKLATILKEGYENPIF